jgi:hypothetical protein
VTCTNSLSTISAVPRRPCLVHPVPRGPASGGGKVEGNLRRRLIELRTDEGSGLAHESLSPAHMGRPDLHHHAWPDCRSTPVRFLTCLWCCRWHADATRPPRAGRRPPARPGWESVVLIVVMGWVLVIAGTLTGLIGRLSAAWLAVVPTAAGSAAELPPVVRQREPGPGGKWRVVGAEVGEEGLSG